MQDESLAIVNANVVTLNSRQSRAEAILIHCGRIAAVGSNEEIRNYTDRHTVLFDAKGRTVVPGLTDCHVHMTSFGRSLQEVDLRNIASIKELQGKIKEYAESNPERSWILGGRWDQERFREKRYPTRRDLDSVVKDKPVFLMRVCGHVGVANTKALELARITKDTVVDGGKVDLDEISGEPSGVLRENALELVKRKSPRHVGAELEETCLTACRKAVEAGLTCVHWMVTSSEEIKAILSLHRERRLPLRVCLGIDIGFVDNIISLGLLTGFGDPMLKIGFVKILADGSMGGRTAAMKEPYSDKPDTSGMMLYTPEKLNGLVQKAHRAGLQLAVHAIGDRAVDIVLKAYEKALEEHPKTDHRHRIEHCSVLDPGLIERMKRLNLVASVQPHFIVSDFWAIDRVGKTRARWVFPFKTLIQKGIVVASGSDCPVELITPILGIWASTARNSFPEESLTVEEALKTYTINASYASFDEDKRGTIEVGKLADLTILSDDPFSIAPHRIKEVTVEMTIVDGKVVYTK